MLAIYLSPVYILLNAYLLHRGFVFAKSFTDFFDKKSVKISICSLYFLIALTPAIAFLLPHSNFERILKLLSNYWLGINLYIAFMVLIASIPRFIFRRKINEHYNLFSGIFTAVAVIAVSFFGILNADNLRTVNDSAIVSKKSSVKNLSVALVSDTHIGYNIGETQMQNMVDIINKNNPDIVVLAGDIFDNEYDAIENPEAIEKILQGIKSKYGVFGCYGNHDVSERVLAGFTFNEKDKKKEADKRMVSFLKNSNITMLSDSKVIIGNDITLYGRKDAAVSKRNNELRKTPAEIAAEVDKSKPLIVIDHEPNDLTALSQVGVDVTLCGHTHDGQLFPLTLLMPLFSDNAYGYKKHGNMSSITTSGVGLFAPKMRVGSTPEVRIINIIFDK